MLIIHKKFLCKLFIGGMGKQVFQVVCKDGTQEEEGILVPGFYCGILKVEAVKYSGNLSDR